MCFNLINIRSRSKNGQRYAFIPCGYCEECRNNTRQQWSVRLALEMQDCVRRGMKIAFFTLTYNDENIPRIPSEFSTSECPCFCRDHVKNFVLALRKWLHRNYGIAGISYLIASDIGTNTYRPHYHGLIAYPVNVPKRSTRYVDKSAPDLFDGLALHDKIKQLWTYGFVFPRHFLGGVDRSGYNHKTFEIQCDAGKASFYAAKYCAKSLNFFNILKDYGVDYKAEGFKQYDCFHVQSKSLGLKYLTRMSFDDKVSLLRNGISFVGMDKVYSLPLYFKNKILFTPKYIVRPDGSRVVEREATDFFDKYYNQIFDEKVNFYSRLARECCCSDMLQVKNAVKVSSREVRDQLNLLRDASGRTFDDLARDYLAYFGVPRSSWYQGLSRADQWYTRYYKRHFEGVLSVNTLALDRDVMPSLHFWSFLLDIIRNNHGIDVDRIVEEDRVRDFHSSYEEYVCSDVDRECRSA